MFIIVLPNRKLLDSIAAAGGTVADEVRSNGIGVGVVFCRTAQKPDAVVGLATEDLDDDPENDVTIKMRYQAAIADRARIISMEQALEAARTNVPPPLGGSAVVADATQRSNNDEDADSDPDRAVFRKQRKLREEANADERAASGSQGKEKDIPPWRAAMEED